MRGLVHHALGLTVLACAAIVVSCGGGGEPEPEPHSTATREDDRLLRSLALSPDDIGEVNWVITQEGSLTDDVSLELSGGLPREAFDSGNHEPQAGHERLIEGYRDRPFGSKEWPPLTYSGLLEFASEEAAKQFFDASIKLAMHIDWLKGHPDPGVDEVTDVLINPQDIPVDPSTSVPDALLALDDVLWLHVTGLISGGTSLTIDDILLLRHGAIWGMVRVPDHLPRGIQSEFEAMAENLAVRLLEDAER